MKTFPEAPARFTIPCGGCRNKTESSGLDYVQARRQAVEEQGWGLYLDALGGIPLCPACAKLRETHNGHACVPLAAPAQQEQDTPDADVDLFASDAYDTWPTLAERLCADCAA